MITVAISGLHAGENPQPGYGVMRSLRRRYRDVAVIGLIYDVLESGIYADDAPNAVFEVPYPSAGIEVLLNRWDYILSQQLIDVFIPTLDAEIEPLIGATDEFERRGVRMMLPTADSFKARSKARLHRLSEACDCRVPRSMSVHDPSSLLEAASELGFPLMVKGQYYGAHRVHTQQALVDKFHATIAEWGAPVILQQCVRGHEFNVMAVGDGEGGMAGSCVVRKTIVSEKGKGFGAVVIRDEILNNLAVMLIEQLGWLGPVELEFIKDDISGDYYLLEVNPRFPAWVDFPSTFGQNLPAVVVQKLMTGRWERLPPYPTGKFFLRHSVDLTCDINDMGQLSTAGEIHHEGKNHGN
ncbi:MAG: biotin carboxylase [Lentisphaerae bacterium]|nr:biotin carboxylase [Lentisphaerota bacterium]